MRLTKYEKETIILFNESEDAASVYPVRLDDFDRDPFLFNCINGTLDLRNGYFRPHSPADMLSKLSGVAYDAGARCERWERHIEEVMEGSTGKALFLQKAMGYTLTGDTQHECFFVLYGPTSRNGKGVTMETFMKLMGVYGRTAKPDSIAQKQTTNSNGPSEDIARLAGARFVNISEPDKKMVLSSALVKTLTGRDKITARFLNENSFEYYPQFKIFINGNHGGFAQDNAFVFHINQAVGRTQIHSQVRGEKTPEIVYYHKPPLFYQFNNGHLGVVALAQPRAVNAAETAGAVGIAGSQHFKQLLQGRGIFQGVFGGAFVVGFGQGD